MSARDIGLFLRSARSDARLGDLLAKGEMPSEAFDRLYSEAEEQDPWGSASTRYSYQSDKYDALLGLLPPERRFRSALDVGCGAGLLARRLAARSASVLGLDLSEVAVGRARELARDQPGLTFQQGDLLALPSDYERRFDLVVVADVIYYLPRANLSATGLAALAAGFSRLLAPDGLLLVANHYFWALDRDSRLSRRIDRAFRASDQLGLHQCWRRPFWLASLFGLRGRGSYDGD